MELNRIYNTDNRFITASLKDGTVDLIIEDMPYNTTKLHFEKEIDLDAYWAERLRIIKDNGAIILTSQQPFTTDLINSCRKYFRYELIWEKKKRTGFLNAARMPLRGHENILVFYRKLPFYAPQKVRIAEVGKIKVKENREDRYAGYGSFASRPYYDNGMRYPHSVLQFGHTGPMRDYFHPTQKPLDLFCWLIKSYSRESDLVFDGFAGSGTTAVACLLLGRKFICCETDANYYEKSMERLETVRRQIGEKGAI